jgi:hypothetical protein
MDNLSPVNKLDEPKANRSFAARFANIKWSKEYEPFTRGVTEADQPAGNAAASASSAGSSEGGDSTPESTTSTKSRKDRYN